MNRPKLFLTLNIALVLFPIAKASATQFVFPGSFCREAGGGTNMQVTAEGALTNTGGLVNVICPVSYSGSALQSNGNNLQMMYNDTSNTQGMGCTPHKLNDATGSLTATGDLVSTCATSGGCDATHPSPSFVGKGALHWTGATGFSLHFSDFTGVNSFICLVPAGFTIYSYWMGS